MLFLWFRGFSPPLRTVIVSVLSLQCAWVWEFWWGIAQLSCDMLRKGISHRYVHRNDATWGEWVSVMQLVGGLLSPLRRYRAICRGGVFTKGRFAKKVVLADVPPERKPEQGYVRMFPRDESRNEGTFACSPGTKTGTRAHSPKPPFYETTLLSLGCPKPQKLAEMKFWDFSHRSRDKTWSEKLGGIWGEMLVGLLHSTWGTKMPRKIRPNFRPILRPKFRLVIKICRHNFALGNVRRHVSLWIWGVAAIVSQDRVIWGQTSQKVGSPEIRAH